MALKNHYAALGVAQDADAVVISAAYRALSKKFHPDTSAIPKHLAAERFREINEAYEVLSDVRRRTEYDVALAGPKARRPPEFTGFTSVPQPYRAASAKKKPLPDPATSPAAWLGFGALCALGLFAAVAWPDLRVPVSTVLVGVLAVLLRFGPAEPDLRPKLRPQPPPPSRKAGMSKGAIAAFALAFWGAIGLILVGLAVAVMIEIALGT